VTGGLVAVDGAETRTEVTVSQVGIGGRAFARGVNGGEELVARGVGVEEEGRSEMETAT
jgi:hypothetical protein